MRFIPSQQHRLRYRIAGTVLAWLALLFTHITLIAQPPLIGGQYYFQREYGGTGSDMLGYHGMEKTRDGGYIMAGSTSSFSTSGIYVVKVTGSGSINWSKVYKYGNAFDIRQTKDGGYVMTGYFNSKALLVKLSSTGALQWQYTYSGGILGNQVQQTSDGGYIVTGKAADTKLFLLKTDASGAQQWAKTYTGGNNDEGWAVQQAADGGYVVAGLTNSFNGNGLSMRVLVMKTTSNGTFSWAKTYGTDFGSGYNVALQPTTGGGYIITAGGSEWALLKRALFLIKIDTSGTQTWGQVYRLATAFINGDVRQLKSGGYIVSGSCPPNAFLMKTTSNGTVTWAKQYGGTATANAYSVAVASDGYALAGFVEGPGIAVAGDRDYYLVKTDTNGTVDCLVSTISPTTATLPAPASVTLTATALGSKTTSTLADTTPSTVLNTACFKVVNWITWDVAVRDFKLLTFGPPVVVGPGLPPFDGGQEPNPDPAYVWKTSAIWLRNTQDPVVGARPAGVVYEHEGEHQNPTFNGSPNYAYVMIDNLGQLASPPATVKVYWSKSATNMEWPTHWVTSIDGSGRLQGNLIGSVAIPSIPPGENYVAELPWTPPNPALFGETQTTCSFLARIESPGDPMAFAEGPSTETNTRANNNIAWHNEVMVSAPEMLVGDPGHAKHVIVRNASAGAATVSLGLHVPVDEQGSNPIISSGSVLLRPDAALYLLWQAGGSLGTNVIDNFDGTISVTAEDAELAGITLEPGEQHLLDVEFSYYGPGLANDMPFMYDIVQNGGLTGGIGFELHFPVLVPEEEGGGGGELKPAMPGATFGTLQAAHRLAASPNPSRGNVQITYTLPSDTYVTVAIYDVRGALVVRMPQGRQGAGNHAVIWNGNDGNGIPVASGGYIYRLETSENVVGRRLQITR